MTRAPRTTRDEDSRTEEWTPANLLPEPIAEDGWSFKWVRKSILGVDDVMNMSRRQREGWVPVGKEEQPHIGAFSESRSEEDTIVVGGLILCKMPAKRTNARNRYYQNLAESQVTGLSDQLKSDAGVDHRMPIEEVRRTKVSRSMDDA